MRFHPRERYLDTSLAVCADLLILWQGDRVAFVTRLHVTQAPGATTSAGCHLWRTMGGGGLLEDYLQVGQLGLGQLGLLDAEGRREAHGGHLKRAVLQQHRVLNRMMIDSGRTCDIATSFFVL